MHYLFVPSRCMCTDTQRDEDDRKILLGDNTGGGAIILLPIRFQQVSDC